MNLALFLERAGRDDPRRPALGFGARVLRDYGDMAGRVARLAGALRSGGLNPGDRVAIVAKNSPNYVEVLYAIWHAGLAAVPANAARQARAAIHELRPADRNEDIRPSALFIENIPLLEKAESRRYL